MTKSKTTCTCPNVKCKRHGDCASCRTNHKNKTMYCELRDGGFRKRLIDRIFGRKK